MSRVIVAPPLLACALALCSFGQFKKIPATHANEPDSKQIQQNRETPDFSSTVELVRLFVTVRDAKGGLLTTLSKEDFHVTDDGASQEIAVFEKNTSMPISAIVLMDTSASTHREIRYESNSVLKFLKAFTQGKEASDVFALYSFGWQVRQETGFTRNVSRAERALRDLKNEGGTSLYDSIYLAGDALSVRDGRHVLIVITDGGDTTSYKKFADAVESAQRADAVVYAVTVVPIANDAGRNTGGEHALSMLAEQTGGKQFNPAGFENLDISFQEILRDLRTQYLIAYYPKKGLPGKKTFHNVRVETRDASHRISTRSGYYEP